MENDFHQLTHPSSADQNPQQELQFTGGGQQQQPQQHHPPPTTTSSSNSNNEADDFVRLDSYHMNDDLDLMMSTDNKDPFSSAANFAPSSTDRPLVTFDEPAPPSAPPSLSPVHEVVSGFEEAAEMAEMHDSPPAYEDTPPLKKGEPDFLYFEPDTTTVKGVTSSYDFGDVDSLSGSPAISRRDDDDDDDDDDDEDDIKDVLSSTPVKKAFVEPPVLTAAAPLKTFMTEPSETMVEFISSAYVEPNVKAVPTAAEQKDEKKTTSVRAGCSCPFSAWFNPQNLDPRVVELVYWRDPKKSGIVFGGILVVLLSLTYFSLISVVAYLSLAVLTATISFRIYKNVLAAVQKSNEGHPFKQFLEQDMVVSNEQIHEIAETVVTHSNAVVHELRRVILVEDLIDSIKFGVMLWCLTYVGAWFNGLTLLILAFVGAFTLPKVYENNKTQIDHYIGIVNAQVNDIMSKVKAKVPIGKKAKEQ